MEGKKKTVLIEVTGRPVRHQNLLNRKGIFVRELYSEGGGNRIP
jgi:hypothetical protein